MRSRFRKILFVVLTCGLTILILKYMYMIHLDKRTFRNNLSDSKWDDKWRHFTTAAKTVQRQMKCTRRTQDKAKLLNMTSLLASMNRTDDQLDNLKPGGRYTPLTCEARHRVAIIVPYRDRETHLKVFLKYIHPFLQQQQLEYGIFVVEPIASVKFNRALLMNIGFVEVNKLHYYDCFIFHDVDLLPESDITNYTCQQSPLHMSSAIDTKKYRLPYRTYFGGVCAFKKEHFEAINGFSNLYFDWGGEDDDLHERIKYSHLRVTHLSPENGRYKMLGHEQAKQNPDKILLFKSMKQRQHSDGLNSLKYNVIHQQLKRLYTLILVNINETLILESEPIHKQALSPKVFDVSRSYTLRRKPSNYSMRRNSINFFKNREQRNHSIYTRKQNN